jgi:hypothetical protein
VNTKTEPPPHWHTSAWPSDWDFDHSRRTEPNLKQVGYVLLPELFHLIIAPDDPAGEDGPAVIVTYCVDDGKVFTSGISGSADVAELITRIGEVFPIDQWKSYAVSLMLKFLTSEEERAKTPPMPTRPPLRASELHQSKNQGAGTRHVGKRHRITDGHLEEVSKVYRAADLVGKPPTRAVAEHFGVAHSTAAKWVGTARRNGKLETVAETIERGVLK